MPSSFMSGQFAGYQASPRHAGSTSSPTPSSWFAVRYVHGFCLMLPPDSPFLEMPLPCWRRPSVRSRRTIMFPTPAGNGGLCVMPGTRRYPRAHAAWSSVLTLIDLPRPEISDCNPKLHCNPDIHHHEFTNAWEDHFKA